MSEPTALDILLKARELPWCQRFYACSAAGDAVSTRSADAVAFCLYGGCARACWDLAREADPEFRDHLDSHAVSLLRRALGEIHGDGQRLAAFNDALDRTEAEVRAVQDRAIELARQEAGRA